MTNHYTADPTTSINITAEELTLDQAIGQMFMFGFRGADYPAASEIALAIKNNALGGYILFEMDVKTRGQRNIISRKQVQKLNSDLQNASIDYTGLPLLAAVDYEGGYVNRLPEKLGFPKTYNAVEFAALPPEEAQAAANSLATTTRDAGFNIDFAPVVDLNVNPDNPIIGAKHRSFSADPAIVKVNAQRIINAFKEVNILSCLKHFPGHGSSTGDSHLGCVDITDTWTNNELLPYYNTDADMVMIGHLVNRQLDPSGLPASLSHKMVQELLREELKFNGIIVSDDLQMQALTDHYSLEDMLTLTINAGCDLIIIAQQLGEDITYTDCLATIKKQIEKGLIAPETIRRAADRILDFKRRLLSQSAVESN